MRTTLTIDDDVLSAAAERGRREKRTTGQVISELARRGLTQHIPDTEQRNGFPVLAKTGRIVTNELIDAIRDEIGE